MPPPPCRSAHPALLGALLALLASVAFAPAVQTSMQPVKAGGATAGQTSVGARKAWVLDDKTPNLTFRPTRQMPLPDNGTLYLAVTYLDDRYGRVTVQCPGKDAKNVLPDRVLRGWLEKTGQPVTALFRLRGVQPGGAPEITIGYERGRGDGLVVLGVALQDKPFADPQFQYLLTDPWLGPYTGPTVKADSSTLKGKVMVGYQGWFRTPNDPYARGWVHWGDIQTGMFTTDMWPDLSQYPPQTLEKAADIKTLSGKPAHLFSSAWPEVTALHFRWMRENNIDGAFLQRFTGSDMYSVKGDPEWVLANVRAEANRQGRIWAIEYDVSSGREATILETMKKDWMFLVDTFGIRKDPNYAHENGKPVVFIWGLPVPDRGFTASTSNAVVDFFKNDPKYGGNYVIGGVPWTWRTLDAGWQEHIKKYDALQPWMSHTYAEDVADFAKMGITYIAHANPGFSWANLMHIPTGSTAAFTPREGGQFYWNSLCDLAKAKADRLCVGMFDEYDESTAVMPMSDDPPPTPSRPGVGLRLVKERAHDGLSMKTVVPSVSLDFSAPLPFKGVSTEHCKLAWGGLITPRAPGEYTFYIEGVVGDSATLKLNDKLVLEVKPFAANLSKGATVKVAAGQKLILMLDYQHGTAPGTVRLLWEGPGLARQPVPESALTDAWGRFLTNEGHPSDWWIRLTRYGKEMMNGQHPVDSQMPQE